MQKYNSFKDFLQNVKPGNIIIDKCGSCFNQGIVYSKNDEYITIFIFKTERGKTKFCFKMLIEKYINYKQTEFFIL